MSPSRDPSRPSRRSIPLPTEFQVERDSPVGRLPLLSVFPGLLDTPPVGKYPGDPEEVRSTMETSWARIYDGFGYMYVAPRKVPAEIRAAGFRMITSRDEEIVIARPYLSGGPKLDLYLDVIHEFLHILQRKAGRELWPGVSVPYVDRPTELEAYAFSIEEARRLGVSDEYLRKYLRVEWVSPADHRRLLERLGVSSSRARGRAKATRGRSAPKPRRIRRGN